MSQTKQKSSAAKNVAIFFVVFIILEMLIIFGISRVFKNEDVTPSFAGYSLYIMSDNSMGNEVPEGALVVAANGVPSVEGIGSAVLVENVPGIGTSVFWLADVSSRGDTMDGVVYTVYQEQNPSALYEVRSSDVVGTASSYYLTAGNVITFVTSTFGMAVCAIVPLFLLVLIELIIAIATHSGEEEKEETEVQEEESSITLDDFLFGGENEKALHHSHAHDEDTGSEEEPKENDDYDDFVVDERIEAVKTYNIIMDEQDDSGNEKPEETPAETAKEPEEKPQSAASKSAAASIEDLMKLMEEEQKKLRDQLDKS